MDPVEISVPVTKPRFCDDTKELAIVAKKQTANDLKRLMHISDDLAAMNYKRFQAFNLESKSNSAKPAGLAFDGDVYWGLAWIVVGHGAGLRAGSPANYFGPLWRPASNGCD